MSATDQTAAQNQIAFGFMAEGEALQPGAAPAVKEFDALAQGAGGGGLVPLVSIIAVAGAAVIALVSSSSGDPLLLTLLAFFAMLGVFLVFGFLAGHIRIGERLQEDDIVAALADGVADGLLVTGRGGVKLFANKMLEEFVGRTASGELETIDGAFAGEGQASEAIFRLTRAAERGEQRQEEFRVRARTPRSSRLIRIAVRPFAVRGAARDLGPLVLWTVRDTTAERAKEAQALESLEKQIADYDASPAGLIVADAQGRITDANTTLLRWLGLEPSALKDRIVRLADVFSPSGAELIQGAAQAMKRDGGAIELDARAQAGRVLPLSLYTHRDAGGRLIVAAVPRETRAEAAGADVPADLRFARFFQSAPFGIATVDADGRIVSSNPAFVRLVLDGDGDAAEPVSAVLAGKAEPEAREAVALAVAQVLAGKPQAAPVEIYSGAQKEFARRVFMSPLARTAGAKEAAILYAIDATEQKALEAKFAQSSKMEAVGKLAGGIAHDFNNVLTAIIGFSDLLLQTHRTSDPAHKDIMHIRNSANRAAGLVAQLLAFSRRQTLEMRPLLLSDVLTDTVPLLRPLIGEKIELKVPPARDLWYVNADRTQLVNVLFNLSANARDAMPNGGTLTLRLKNVSERECQKLNYDGLAIGEYVLIEVEDTGTGMSPEVMAKVFEPFFTTKAVGKGTGLGLSTVYGFVKQCGGFVYPDSALGRGTTFRIFLPRHHIEAEDDLAAVSGKKKEKPADLTGSGRVLLVEDEDVVRQFAVRALTRQGYEVLEASTGVEALDVMSRNEGRIDLVVSDVVMPEMDGPTLLKELRKTNPNLKIIFVSGYPHEAFETSLDKDEQFAFLPKPFSLPQLAAKVKDELAK